VLTILQVMLDFLHSAPNPLQADLSFTHPVQFQFDFRHGAKSAQRQNAGSDRAYPQPRSFQ
jgi:hypothetical protein